MTLTLTTYNLLLSTRTRSLLLRQRVASGICRMQWTVAMMTAENAAESQWQRSATTRVQARRDQRQALGGAHLAVAWATLHSVARPSLVRNVEWQQLNSAACAVAMDTRRRIIRFRRPRWRRRLGSLTLSRAMARARTSAGKRAREAFVSLGVPRVRVHVDGIAHSLIRQQAQLSLGRLMGSLLARKCRHPIRRKP